jgi:hypothetical protein
MSRSRHTTAAQRVAAVVVGLLAALPVAGVALVVSASPASASTYRYWTYWWGTDTGKPHSGWKFASQGPAFHPVGDRWVLGWRFATSTAAGGKPPRVAASYDQLCSDPVPTDGSVRVALVVDYGTSADAPPGEKPPSTSSVRKACVVVPAGSTGATVLSTAGIMVRDDGKGLICGLDGYPRRECAPVIADPVATPTPTPSATSTRRGSATPTASTGAGSGTSSHPASTTTTAAAVTASGSPATPPAARTASSSAASTVSASSSSSDEATLPAVAGAPLATTTEESSTGPIGVVAGVLVVGGLAGSAWWTTRRGGRAT